MGRSARVGGGEGGVPFRVGVRLRGPFPIFFLGGRVGGGGGCGSRFRFGFGVSGLGMAAEWGGAAVGRGSGSGSGCKGGVVGIRVRGN